MIQEVVQDQQFRNKIIGLVKAGKKITAVKTVKKATGLGLKDSLGIVEEITNQKMNPDNNSYKNQEVNPKAPQFIERKEADRSFLIYALIFLAVLIVSYYLSNS